MSSNTNPDWYGKFHDAQPIPNLLREFSVDPDDRRFCIDYADGDDEPSCRELVAQSRSSGDNVGLGEYLNEDDFMSLFVPSQVFAVRTVSVVSDGHTEKQRLSAVVVVQTSLFARYRIYTNVNLLPGVYTNGNCFRSV